MIAAGFQPFGFSSPEAPPERDLASLVAQVDGQEMSQQLS